jgi:hypothetical protein
MKINELTSKNEYSAKNIAQKQKRMAQNLQTRWARDKKALLQQGKSMSVVDYVARTLPIVSKVAPDLGKNMPANASLRVENNYIAQALNIALEKTNYWQRQIEKRAGMDPSPYNTPTAANPAPPAPGTAPMAPRSPRIAGGTTVQTNIGEFVWNGSKWVRGDNGQPATAAMTKLLTARAVGATS